MALPSERLRDMGVGAGGAEVPGAALAALEGEADYWASLRDLREAVAWDGESGGRGAGGGEGSEGAGTSLTGGASPRDAVSAESLRAEAREWLERNGVAARIRNRVGALRERQGAVSRGGGMGGGDGRGGEWGSHPQVGERLTTLRNRFSIFVQDRVNLLASEHQLPLERSTHSPSKAPRGRLASERVGERDWDVVSTGPENFVFTPQDLFEALSPGRSHLDRSCSSFPSQAMEGQEEGVSWGEVPFRFQTPEPSKLKDIFPEMGVQHRQIGVDDCTDGGGWFVDKREKLAREALSDGSMPLCRRFCRQGVPNANRREMWKAALGVEVTERANAYFETLCGAVETSESLADYLVNCDVKALICNQHYFVFEETIRVVARAFLQDVAVPSKACIPIFPRILRQSHSGDSQGLYPPNGVVPFRGLAMYIAPLCLLHQSPADCYYTFRALYCRHFCRLHSLHPGGMPAPSLPVLAKTFEDLAQYMEPEVCLHLLNVGLPPLFLGLPWMVNAFADVFEPQDVLAIWDRVVGYDSLLPLAVVAVGILRFRRARILKADLPQDVKAALSDISRLKPIVMMQELLCALERDLRS